MYTIYKIHNSKNGKSYVGLSCNPERRLKRHFSDLKNGVHDNKLLQSEWDRDGKEFFSSCLLQEEIHSYEEAGEREVQWIQKLDTYHNGYNQNRGGNFGPSNGGTKFTKKEIFSILSVIEFESRPGQKLSEIFNVSRTTISRIKKGDSHTFYYLEFKELPQEEKIAIFREFNDEHLIQSRLKKSHALLAKRRLTKEQVFMIYLNNENKVVSKETLKKAFGLASKYTIDCAIKEITYQDLREEYLKLDDENKNKIASLLRNLQK